MGRESRAVTPMVIIGIVALTLLVAILSTVAIFNALELNTAQDDRHEFFTFDVCEARISREFYKLISERIDGELSSAEFKARVRTFVPKFGSCEVRLPQGIRLINPVPTTTKGK